MRLSNKMKKLEDSLKMKVIFIFRPEEKLNLWGFTVK